MYAFYAFLAFITSFVSIYFLLKLPEKISVLDNPNHRSLHSKPVSRLGGVAILLGIVVSGLFYSQSIIYIPELWFIFIGLLMISVISLIDDVFSLDSLIRLAIQLMAACLIVSAGFVLDSTVISFIEIRLPIYFAVVVTVLYTVWMVNLYNFMDGIDGLAGGMTVIGFGALATIGFIEGQQVFAVVNIIVASSSFGFLLWNYPPAKLFMGDSGSSSLGFLFAVISIWGHVAGIVEIWVSLIIFSPFIVDATVTLLYRMIKRQRFWDAHKSHYYQRLADSGMGRRKLVHYEYILMLVCSAIAMVSYNASASIQLVALLFLIIMYFSLMYYISTKILVLDKTI